jgi:hypothetical protein
MSKTRRRVKRDDCDVRFVPPLDPLFRSGVGTLYSDGDLVLGNPLWLEDPRPRVGLVININCQCDVYGGDVIPKHHRVMWSDGSFEVNSEDDLTPVSCS